MTLYYSSVFFTNTLLLEHILFLASKIIGNTTTCYASYVKFHTDETKVGPTKMVVL